MKRLLLSLAIALGMSAWSANADSSGDDPGSFSSGPAQHSKSHKHQASTGKRNAHAIKRTRKSGTKTVTNIRSGGKAGTRRASTKSAAKTRSANKEAGTKTVTSVRSGGKASTRRPSTKSVAKVRTANKEAGTRRVKTKSAAKTSAAKGGAYATRRARLLPAVKSATPSHIPVNLVDAIISKESSYDATARGSQGEIGLMQIMPSTARQIARKLGQNAVAGLSDAKLRSFLSEPANNLKFGLSYLSTCHKMAKGNIAATVGCYNAGPGNMWHWGKIKLTRAYVNFVRTHMASEG